MKATELLKKQHDEVKELFEELESASSSSRQRKLFEELAAKLVAHDGIERQIFYPRCEEKMGMSELLGEALVEHGLVEFSVMQADRALGEDDFEYKLTVLRETLEHHIDEEEGELFSKVKKAFDSEDLEQLGMELEEKFEQLLRKDFRAPLRSNLKQVMAGSIKPRPPANGARRSQARSKQRPAAKSARSQAPARRVSAARKTKGGQRKAARRSTRSA